MKNGIMQIIKQETVWYIFKCSEFLVVRIHKMNFRDVIRQIQVFQKLRERELWDGPEWGVSTRF